MVQSRWLAVVVALLSSGCASSGQRCTRSGLDGLTDMPFAVVLGTAQDGGLPQIACEQELCRRARRQPEFRRLVASLMIVDPRSGKRWLIDATPDLPEQVELAERFAARRRVAGRPPLFDGIFLTHAHFGHYTGLAYLGREVYGSEGTTVWVSRRMEEYLTTNGPWDLLIQAGHISLRAVRPGQSIELAQDLVVRPFLVPHRDEYSDTFGFLIEGPERSLIYIPDIDKWSTFEPGIEDLIRDCDHALLDGSFFAEGEIPGRAMADIPHPFIVESLTRFAKLPARERSKVLFTHLNHTNPASDPNSTAAEEIRAAGCEVARDGLLLSL